MNMFKKNGGFTLVELIVVIAILAILAAVAVPAYSGYITKANDVKAETTLAAIKTAAMGAMATTGAVETIEVTCNADGKVQDVTINGSIKLLEDGAAIANNTVSQDFWTFLNETQPVLDGSYKTSKEAYWATGADKWAKEIPTT